MVRYLSRCVLLHGLPVMLDKRGANTDDSWRTVTLPRSIFITGIGGFIGSRLAYRCGQLGIRAWGVDHDPASVSRARALGVEAVLGDIHDSTAMSRHVEGAEAVVHTAAIVKEYGKLAEFRRVNVEGSLSVARAARAAGARSFVQLSSVMVYGFDFPPDVDESGPLRGEGNPYCLTKIESEQAVLSLDDPPRFGVILIRPGDVYGPGSIPWIGRPLQMLRKRRLLLPMGGRGLINHVYVDNLVDGLLAALEFRAYGQAFNITDGTASTCGDYFSRLASAAGAPGPRVVPTAVMHVLTRLLQAGHRLGLTADEAGPDTVRYLSRPHTYSIEKARRQLGYVPKVDLEQGFALTQPYLDRL